MLQKATLAKTRKHQVRILNLPLQTNTKYYIASVVMYILAYLEKEYIKNEIDHVIKQKLYCTLSYKGKFLLFASQYKRMAQNRNAIESTNLLQRRKS